MPRRIVIDIDILFKIIFNIITALILFWFMLISFEMI
jgi:hypothetical protein